jgi:hypothetical protein
MQTFQKEVTFLSKTPNSFNIETNAWDYEQVTKTATFKELSRTDRDQHKLHFKIVALFTGGNIEREEDEKAGTTLESDDIYDLTVKCIKKLLIIDENFTAQNREEFLTDSGAIMNFGFWLLGEKIAPFFSILIKV